MDFNFRGLIRFWLVRVLAACSLLSCSAYAATPAPIEAFAALPSYSQPTLSADGRFLAYAGPREDGNYDIFIRDLKSAHLQRIELGPKLPSFIFFEDGGALMIIVGETRNDYQKFFGNTMYILLPDAETSVGNINWKIRELSAAFLSSLKDQPDVILAGQEEFNPIDQTWTLETYRLNIRNGSRLSDTTKLTEQVYQASIDSNGEAELLLKHNSRFGTGSISIRKPDQSWQQVLSVEGQKEKPFSIIGRAPTGEVVFWQRATAATGELSAVNLQTGKIRTFIRAEGVVIENGITDQWRGGLVGLTLGGLTPASFWLDPQFAELAATLEANMPGKKVELASYTRDRKRVLFWTSEGANPRKLWLYDATAESINLIAATQPQLNTVPMGKVTATSFTARDGNEIPIYVTTPPGLEGAQNAPTVVLPHGGPEARDYPDFDWVTQFLASRGYVVLQPQFRGSSGFGHRHADAGRRQWGKLMQDDVTDALVWATKTHLTDPQRACIAGFSYGGYASLVGATLTPDLYKCAISVAGISDLNRLMLSEGANSEGANDSTVAYLRAHIGTNTDRELTNASPRNFANKVTAPVLLIHGTDDLTVPLSQSKMMETALQQARKPVRFVQIPKETHNLDKASSRLIVLREIETFLAANLGPGLTPASASAPPR